VKLIDVYPEDHAKDPSLGGYQLMVAGEVLRGRFRMSFEKPEPIVANQVEEVAVSLRWRSHCFPRGHKIMVQVQSTWFPLIDRNPQRFVPNIFKARDPDFVTAVHRVFRSGQHPSHVELPVVTGHSAPGTRRPP
jgi:predicted acyl esterase